MGLFLLKRVAYGLHADGTVLEDKRVDAVVDLGFGGIGGPFKNRMSFSKSCVFRFHFAFGTSESSFVKA